MAPPNPFSSIGKRRSSLKAPSGGRSRDEGLGTFLGMILGHQLAKDIPEQYSSLREKLPSQLPPGSEINLGKTPSASIPVSRKFTSEESRQLGLTRNVDNVIGRFKSQMQDPVSFRSNFEAATFPNIANPKKPGYLGPIPVTYGNMGAMRIQYYISYLNNVLIRLRSGAQINESEFERLQANMPTYKDISDPNDLNFELVNEKLDLFSSELAYTENFLVNGMSYSDSGQPMIYIPGIWDASVDPDNLKVKVKRGVRLGTIDSEDELQDTDEVQF